MVVSGAAVAKESEAVAVNSYRNLLQGQGYLRVLSNPITPANDASTAARA